MTYEIEVCPFCGAQVSYDGGYDGYGYIFDCEHDQWMDEYGSVEPLKIAVTPKGIARALAHAAPRLEEQRIAKAEKDAEAKRKAQPCWDALSPEEQERERHRAEMWSTLRSAWATGPLTDLLGLQATVPTSERKVNE